MQQLARSAPQMDSAPDLKLYVAGQEKELQRTQVVVAAVVFVVVGVVVVVVVVHTLTQFFSDSVPAHRG